MFYLDIRDGTAHYTGQEYWEKTKEEIGAIEISAEEFAAMRRAQALEEYQKEVEAIEIPRLSARQYDLIAYMVAHPKTTAAECLRECNIPKSTYYEWRNKKEFNQELNRQIKAKWADSERLATDTMINLCSKGDFQATKYILDNLGYKATEKVSADVNATTTISINIEEDNEDKLES